MPTEPITSQNRHWTYSLIGLALSGALAACGQGKEPNTASNQPSQVLARVQGQDITESQFNFEIQRMGPSASAEPSFRSRALEQLVARSVLAKAATEQGIERDANFILAVDAYRQQLLAESYLTKKPNLTQHTVTPSEVSAYYDANPHLYAKRRLFDLRVMHCRVAPLPEAIKADLDKASNWNSIQTVVEKAGLKCSVGTPVTDAHALSAHSQSRMEQVKAGDVLTVQTDQQTTLLYVAQVMNAPMSQQEAEPLIQAALLQQKVRKSVDAEVQRLSKASPPEYLAKFYAATPDSN